MESFMTPIFPLTEKTLFDESGYRAMQRLSLNTTTVAGPCDDRNGQNAHAPDSRQRIMMMSRMDIRRRVVGIF
jgi:hypothetical protein